MCVALDLSHSISSQDSNPLNFFQVLERRQGVTFSSINVSLIWFQGSMGSGMPRFMASSHVVLGHLFARGVAAPIYFFHWGFTWVCLGGCFPCFP